MPEKVKIIDARRIPSGKPERVGLFDWAITYQITPVETYVVVIQKDPITDEDIKQAIRKDIEVRKKFIKEIEI